MQFYEALSTEVIKWQDKSSYQKAFKWLLRDLKATGGQVNGE